ncbi:hypothetical protein MPDQ_005811 [Monascus purpureus]|uniref:C2H2-type domain-containing protein n=1 Tax=Monascus purpureus TaxID=5098 RepID=A0A507QFZ9_MONPU|nr:hypothetical protein MPDQ_005811 [Monascus purpureus]
MEDEKISPDKPKKKTTNAQRKSLTCKYCGRPFARLEHLQRHLRTRCIRKRNPSPVIIAPNHSQGGKTGPNTASNLQSTLANLRKLSQ